LGSSLGIGSGNCGIREAGIDLEFGAIKFSPVLGKNYLVSSSKLEYGYPNSMRSKLGTFTIIHLNE
jgi:hypothetical protein